MKNKIKEKGFALVEMVVVLGIIGIVTGIVLMSLDTARSQSRDKTRISDIKNIQLALEVYYSHNKHYPNTLEDLITDGEFTASTLPTDPTSHLRYEYVSYNKNLNSGSINCRSYHLITKLENSNQFLQDAEHFDSTSVPVICGGNGFDASNKTNNPNFYYDVKSKY